MEDVLDTNSKTDDIISSLTDYFPVLSIIGLGYGIINQYSYYLPFNINILEYTDFSELLLDTLNHLIIIVIPGLFIIILLTSIIFKILDKQDKQLTNLDVPGQLEYFNRASTRYSRRKKIITWIMFSGYSALILLYVGEYFLYKIFNILNFLFALLNGFFGMSFILYLDYFPPIFKKIFNKEISKRLYVLIACCIIFLWIAICNGLYRSNKVKNHSTLGTYAIIGKDTIKSTKKYFYIGKTKGYLFFYNDSTKHTDVINSKDMKILSIN